jgi:glycosidase
MFTYPGIPLIYNGEEVGNNKKLSLFEKVNIDWNKGKDFRDLYTKLSSLRKEHEALRVGTYASLRNTGGPKLYSFVRQTASDTVVVVLNLSSKSVQAEIMLPPLKNVKLKEFFSSREFQVAGNTIGFTLPAFGYMVITTQ